MVWYQRKEEIQSQSLTHTEKIRQGDKISDFPFHLIMDELKVSMNDKRRRSMISSLIIIMANPANESYVKPTADLAGLPKFT